MVFNILKSYQSRIPELDGVRGLAVLMVIGFHYVNNQLVLTNSSSSIVIAISKSTSFLWSGVDLFFILSGYLIGSILLKNKGAKNYFKAFYFRRFLRIIPLFYLLLLCYVMVKKMGIADPGNFLYINELPLWPYFLFIHNYVMASHATFGPQGLAPMWSLAVEEQFYLILPTLIFFVRRKWLPYIIVPCMIIAPIFRAYSGTWYGSYFPFHARMDTLLFGVLIAYWVSEKALVEKVKNRSVLVGALLFSFLALGVFLSLINKIGVLNHTIFMIVYGLFLICALVYTKGILGKVLRTSTLRFFGLLSYGIYVFHQLITGVLHSVLLQDRPRLSNMSNVSITVLSFAITVLVAYLLHLVLERPLVKVGHRFKYN